MPQNPKTREKTLPGLFRQIADELERTGEKIKVDFQREMDRPVGELLSTILKQIQQGKATKQ